MTRKNDNVVSEAPPSGEPLSYEHRGHLLGFEPAVSATGHGVDGRWSED